jgi:hypothetical protein
VGVAGGLGVDPAEVAVFFEQPQGWLEVGGLGEAAAGGGGVGVAAAELGPAAAADPVQQPAGVVDSGVGAHQVEHRPGVLDQVASQADGAGDGVAADRVDPAAAEVAGEMQEGGESAGGPGELGRRSQGRESIGDPVGYTTTPTWAAPSTCCTRSRKRPHGRGSQAGWCLPPR